MHSILSHQSVRLTLECVIAPMLFTPMLQDVGKGLQKDTTLTAYADALAIWTTTTFRWPNKNGPPAEIGPENLPKRGEHHSSLPQGQRVCVVSPKDCLHACPAKGSELTRQPANRRPRDTHKRIPFRALPRGHLPM